MYLVAVDGSQASEQALERALALATDAGAALTLITVQDLHVVEAPGVAGAAAVALSFEAIEESSRRVVEESKRKAAAARVAVAEAVVAVGHPAAEIVRKARAVGADLVVVGSHSRTGVPRALLGSVAENVVRKAPCSVLVVR